MHRQANGLRGYRRRCSGPDQSTRHRFSCIHRASHSRWERPASPQPVRLWPAASRATSTHRLPTRLTLRRCGSCSSRNRTSGMVASLLHPRPIFVPPLPMPHYTATHHNTPHHTTTQHNTTQHNATCHTPHHSAPTHPVRPRPISSNPTWPSRPTLRLSRCVRVRLLRLLPGTQ